MRRREFMTALAAGLAAALSGCTARPAAVAPGTSSEVSATVDPAGDGLPAAVTSSDPIPTVTLPTATPSTGPLPTLPSQTEGTSRPPAANAVVPGAARTIDRLPAGKAPRLALTIDDGTSTPVVEAFVDFIATTGIRLTFFVNGANASWTAVKAKLAPLVDSGQVQLANHTWNHPSITELSAAQITDQLQRNETFLHNTYGVNGRPYFRPPFGHHNATTDAVTGNLGFDRTIMWFGTLGDATPVSAETLVANARTWFQPDHIVIGHANRQPITQTFGQLTDIIRSRALQTVTLRDVFGDQPYGRPTPSSPRKITR